MARLDIAWTRVSAVFRPTSCPSRTIESEAAAGGMALRRLRLFPKEESCSSSFVKTAVLPTRLDLSP